MFMGLSENYCKQRYFRQWCGHSFLFLLILAGLLTGKPAQAVELIAHPSISERTLSQNEARAFFYMRNRVWSDGLPVTIFVLNDDSDIHRNFSKQQLGLFPYRLRRVWDRHLYSGTGQIPIQVKNSSEMIKRVASTPGAIGYADKESIDEGVQIIEIR